MSIGIDFGYSSVKIVQLEKRSDKYVLQKVGIKSVVDDLNKYDPEKISKSQWTAAVMDLCKEMKINPKKMKKAVSSISGTNISAKQITTLEMSDEELVASLEFEAKKHIPLDGTEAVLDYHILGYHPTELDKINVLLLSTTKNIINNHAEIIKNAGFKGGIFDADPVAIVNTYLANHEKPEEGVDVILNIGNMSSSLIVWGKNHQFFNRELSYGGHHFTKATMKTHQVDYNSAEGIKIKEGVESCSEVSNDDSDSAFSIQVADKTIYSKLIDEIRKTLRYYIKTNNQAFFKKFYLSGGSANLIGLKEMIHENLNVEIEIIDPFTNMENNEDNENPAQYVIATGLAIRGLEMGKK
jgi:type IV pilus assembly protein PilM